LAVLQGVQPAGVSPALIAASKKHWHWGCCELRDKLPSSFVRCTIIAHSGTQLESMKASNRSIDSLASLNGATKAWACGETNPPLASAA